MWHAALALDAEDEPRSANDQPVLLVDDQDLQPHGIVRSGASDLRMLRVGLRIFPGECRPCLVAWNHLGREMENQPACRSMWTCTTR